MTTESSFTAISDRFFPDISKIRTTDQMKEIICMVRGFTDVRLEEKTLCEP